MGFQASGVSGEVRYGYQVAARLRDWTLNDQGRVDATAYDRQEFWLSEGPWSVWLTMGAKAWVWKQANMLDNSERMALRVEGPCEVRPAPSR